MEETSRKREGCDRDDDPTVIKRPRTPLCSSEEDDIINDGYWVLMEDEEVSTVDELMKFLDDTTSNDPFGVNINSNAIKVKFVQYPFGSSSSSSALNNVFQSSSSYITINRNEETCGSSFSDWESSVMASVHMAGFLNSPKLRCCCIDDGFDWFQGGDGGAWVFNEVEAEARDSTSGGSDWDLVHLDYEEGFLGGDH